MSQSNGESAPVKSNIVRARISVRGIRPLLQHSFGPDSLPLEKGERTGVAGNDPEEWRKTCMVTKDGQLYIRGTYVFACIRDASRHLKSGRGSIQPKVAATLQVEEPNILISAFMPADSKDPPHSQGPPADCPDATVYIDVCGVRNPSTKARNVRYRLACSSGWRCSFVILWDRTLVSREQMRSVLTDAAILCGLGDGRGVGNGRFEVEKYEELTNASETTASGSLGGQSQTDRVAPRQGKVRPVRETASAD